LALILYSLTSKPTYYILLNDMGYWNWWQIW